MDRKEAINALKLINLKSVHPFLSWEEMLEVRNMAIEALQEPERKKGQWERFHKYENGSDKWGYRCPECGNEIPDDDCTIIKNLLPPNFCEQCGADMRKNTSQ